MSNMPLSAPGAAAVSAKNFYILPLLLTFISIVAASCILPLDRQIFTAAGVCAVGSILATVCMLPLLALGGFDASIYGVGMLSLIIVDKFAAEGSAGLAKAGGCLAAAAVFFTVLNTILTLRCRLSVFWTTMITNIAACTAAVIICRQGGNCSFPLQNQGLSFEQYWHMLPKFYSDPACLAVLGAAAAAAAIGVAYLLFASSSGRQIRAIGASPEQARLSGVRLAPNVGIAYFVSIAGAMLFLIAANKILPENSLNFLRSPIENVYRLAAGQEWLPDALAKGVIFWLTTLVLSLPLAASAACGGGFGNRGAVSVGGAVLSAAAIALGGFVLYFENTACDWRIMIGGYVLLLIVGWRWQKVRRS